MEEGTKPVQFIHMYPSLHSRASVREPVDGRIHLPMWSVNAPRIQAELSLNAHQALELIRLLTTELEKLCRRADISRALRSKETGLLTETGGR